MNAHLLPSQESPPVEPSPPDRHAQAGNDELKALAKRYPEADAALAQADELWTQAFSLLPDHAPELAPYLDWSHSAAVLMRLALSTWPESNPSDGSEKTYRQRMARNFIINALETLEETMTVEKVCALTAACFAVHAETSVSVQHPEVEP